MHSFVRYVIFLSVGKNISNSVNLILKPTVVELVSKSIKLLLFLNAVRANKLERLFISSLDK
jgi:hypothetical protein